MIILSGREITRAARSNLASPPPSIEDKNERSRTSTPPIRIRGVDKENFQNFLTLKTDCDKTPSFNRSFFLFLHLFLLFLAFSSVSACVLSRLFSFSTASFVIAYHHLLLRLIDWTNLQFF